MPRVRAIILDSTGPLLGGLRHCPYYRPAWKDGYGCWTEQCASESLHADMRMQCCLNNRPYRAYRRLYMHLTSFAKRRNMPPGPLVWTLALTRPARAPRRTRSDWLTHAFCHITSHTSLSLQTQALRMPSAHAVHVSDMADTAA
jgi:hypothetical protein